MLLHTQRERAVPLSAQAASQPASMVPLARPMNPITQEPDAMVEEKKGTRKKKAERCN